MHGTRIMLSARVELDMTCALLKIQSTKHESDCRCVVNVKTQRTDGTKYRLIRNLGRA